MNELIQKRKIEDSNYESANTKAKREYLWTRMTDAIFTEEPIDFYSTQMKKYYLPPQIKKLMTREKLPHELTGKAARALVQFNNVFSMVIPDTFEKEKWEQQTKQDEINKKILIAHKNAQ